MLRKALNNGGLIVGELNQALAGLPVKDQEDPELAELTVRVLCRWANKQASLIDEQQRETQLNKAKEALVRVTGPNVRKTLLENPDVKPFVDAHDLPGN